MLRGENMSEEGEGGIERGRGKEMSEESEGEEE